MWPEHRCTPVSMEHPSVPASELPQGPSPGSCDLERVGDGSSVAVADFCLPELHEPPEAGAEPGGHGGCLH